MVSDNDNSDLPPLTQSSLAEITRAVTQAFGAVGSALQDHHPAAAATAILGMQQCMERDLYPLLSEPELKAIRTMAASIAANAKPVVDYGGENSTKH